MITYLLQVSFCWVFFYLVYYLFLRRETFFSINRWYLLSTILISIIIPPVGEWIKDLFTTYPVDAGQILYIVSETPAYVNEVIIQNDRVNWLPIIIQIIYVVGIALASLRFAIGLRKIYRLYLAGEKKVGKTFTLVTSRQYHLPFSFFRYVFISKKAPLKEGYQKIIEHELTHVKNWHSLDILIIELLHIFFWFNPILHFYRRALQQSHEFYVDACILKHHSTKDYGALLLDPTMSGLELALVNQFFNSHLKNRITMMYQKRSSRSSLAKYLVSLPILALALFLFSNSMIVPISDPIPFKSEVKAAIQSAENMEDLSSQVMSIITEHRTTDQMPNDTINMYLREVFRETGLSMQLMSGKNFNFSQDRDLAKQSGYLEHLDRIFEMPPIVTKLYDLIEEIAGKRPLLRINGNLIYGHWRFLDPNKILSYKYITSEEAMERYGDMAHGGVIDFELSEFTESDLDKTGVIIEATKGFNPEKGAVKNVDTPARFHGCEGISGDEASLCGIERFNEYIADVLQYPEEAKKLGIEGTIMVRFLVTEKGAIGSPTILNDIGGGCAKEARYLIQSMNTISDSWTPATKGGEPVKSIVTMPIRFSLQGEVSKKVFSARHESNLDGDIKKSMPEVMENPKLVRDMIALLSDFEINPRPLFVLDGKIMEKDSVLLNANQVSKAILLNEEEAAIKYETTNQRALEIYTGTNGPTTKEAISSIGTTSKENPNKIIIREATEPFVRDLLLFPNPAKFDINISFHAVAAPLEIRIHDTAGKLLFKETLPDFNGVYDQKLSSKDFVNAEAIISFMQNDQVQTEKIIFAK